MPTTASGYLNEAQHGLEHVRSKIDLGSSNKFLDNLRTLTITKFAVDSVYKDEENYLKASGVPLNLTDWDKFGLKYIEAMSTAAEGMGAGNCEELTAMAFMYFYRRQVFPIDYMQIPGRHAFCVIGAPCRPETSNFKDWSTGTATVCDPWANRAQ